MPRPPFKRRWQNKTSPKRRVQIPNQTQTRQALQRKLSDVPVGKRPEDSDDSDELITSKSITGGRKRQEIYGSGAVAKGDKPGAYPTRSQRTRSMRDETEEILSSRSRSTSRAPSASSVRNSPKSVEKAPTTSRTSTKSNKPQLISQPSTMVAKSVVNSVAPTPRAEASILGAIKPRKRQASILQIIENERNDDSTRFSLGEEELFLPDDTSIPSGVQQDADEYSPVGRSSTLKRKRGQLESGGEDLANSSNRSSSLPTYISPPSRSQSKKLRKVPAPEPSNDIMAPPESSDDEASLEEPQITQAPNRGSKPFAPTTEQLQNLMPSKKRAQPQRQRKGQEFDIPADASDSADNEDNDENEHSAFVPTKSRSKRAQKRPQRQKPPANKLHKTKTKVKDKSRSTNTLTPSPVRLRTPLPLSARTQAKSGDQQGTISREKSTIQVLSVASPTKGQRKRYGGTQPRAAGKENQPVLLSDKPLDHNETNRKITKRTKTKALHDAPADVKAWKKKWAAIDDFDLAFEDVSNSISSSPPS